MQTAIPKRPCITLVASYLLQRNHGWSFPTTYWRSTAGEYIDRAFLIATLKACSVSKLLDFGKEVHQGLEAETGLLDQSLANALVNMYGKCGSMSDAYSVFRTMASRDVVSWNSLIFGYAVNGQPDHALELLSAMEAEGHKPTSRTYVAVLVACSKLAEEETAKQADGKLVKVNSLELAVRIHGKATSSGCVDIYVGTALINLYSNCGNMLEASRVFHRMPEYNVVSWSALIQGFAENGESELALRYFEAMQREGLELDARTYVAALVALTGLAGGEEVDGKASNEWMSRGRAIHSQITGPMDIFLASTLVNFYLKCGSLTEAKLVFDNMVHRDVASWNTLLLGYVENGEYELALKLFSDMNLERCAPDARTVTAALLACGSLAAEEESAEVAGKLLKLKCLEKGMKVHAQARDFSLSEEFFVCSALVDMYSKCGSMEDARRVFERMLCHDVVSWTAFILGYAETGEGELALKLFARMKDGDCAPNELTHVAALVACGNGVKLKDGKGVHGDILRSGYGNTGVVGSSLVDFYAKCGSMDKAEQVFLSLENRSLVTWSALIGGYSRQGKTALRLVFQHFESMNEEGVKPNGVTILSVLTACSHAGLVDKGRKLFESMSSLYGVKPEIDHYRCMVDTLSRANRLEEAVNLAVSMPYQADALTWNTILGGCCKWKNVEIGKLALECMLRLDVNQPAAYTLMGNIYSSLGMWNERATVLRGKIV